MYAPKLLALVLIGLSISFPKEYPAIILSNAGREYIAFEYPHPATEVVIALQEHKLLQEQAVAYSNLLTNTTIYQGNEVEALEEDLWKARKRNWLMMCGWIITLAFAIFL